MNSKSLTRRPEQAPLGSVPESQAPERAPHRSKRKSDASIRASLAKFWRLLGPRYSRQFVFLSLVMILQALLEAASLGGIPAFVAALASPESVLQHARVQPLVERFDIRTPTTLLVVFGVLLVCLFAVKNAIAYLSSWLQARFKKRVRDYIGTRLFTAYMHAPHTFHLKRNPADLVRNANTELERMLTQVLGPTLSIIANGLIGVVVLALILMVQPLLTLFGAVLFAIASYGLLAAMRARAMAHGRSAQRHRAELIKAVNQGIGGLKEARVLGRQDEFIRTFEKSNVELALAMQHRSVTSSMIGPTLEFVGIFGLTALVALLSSVGMTAIEILPILALFAASLLRLRQATVLVSTTINGLQYEHVTVDPIYDDLMALEHLEGIAKRPADGQGTPLRDAIELDNVSFQYPESELWALRNVSLRIPRGASVALIGATGAGKSTLADILLGLLQPKEGVVRVDGRDIREDLGAWQASLGYIPQALYLLDDTVRRNIAFGLPDASIDEERVLRAARMAQLDEVLAQMPEGLDTTIGDRGVRLSGGQRQRVCIARALYNDPDVLILDEATSALDNLTEKKIVEELEAQRGHRTLIIIAHRLTTVQRCDTLYLLRDGRVESFGTYAELSDRSSAFQQLAAVDG